jgi:hypothetical protein
MDENIRELRKEISDLKIEIDSERRWNEIPEVLKPTSKSRWDQLKEKRKAQNRRYI